MRGRVNLLIAAIVGIAASGTEFPAEVSLRTDRHRFGLRAPESLREFPMLLIQTDMIRMKCLSRASPHAEDRHEQHQPRHQSSSQLGALDARQQPGGSEA